MLLANIAALLIALGFLVPLTIGPQATFLTEWLAVAGWLLMATAHFLRGGALFPHKPTNYRLLLLVTGFLIALVVLDLVLGRFAYVGTAITYALYFLAALTASWVGWQVFSAVTLGSLGAASFAAKTYTNVLFALLGAALLNGIVAFTQYIGVHGPDWLIASVQQGARVFGNVRQANLYSLLEVLGLISAMALANAQSAATPKRNRGFYLVAVLLGAAAALSVSRTGAVMLWAILVVAWVGKGLLRTPRLMIFLAVVAHAATWIGCQVLEKTGWLRYEVMGTVQFTPGGGNFTSFRSEIWSAMLGLVADHPFVGAGTGNAGYAYFMKELPFRMDLNMQHAHNLPLQIAVEHGAVFCLLWLGLIGALLWRARSAWFDPVGRILGLALLAFAIHSNLEYPLWYMYFLLPCAFAFGGFVAIGSAAPADAPAAIKPAAKSVIAVGLGAALLLGAVGLDYRRILPAFQSATHEEALVNLERGYGTLLFTHWMDYAVVSNVAVTPENARTHYNVTKRLSRIIIQPSTLISLSLASAMLGKTDEAAFYLRRIQEMSGSGIEQVWRTLTPEEQKVLLPALQKLGAVVR